MDDEAPGTPGAECGFACPIGPATHVWRQPQWWVNTCWRPGTTIVGRLQIWLVRMCLEWPLRALPVLDEALFSLHGACPEVHDPLTRRAGSFERVTRAIRLARAHKPGFGLFINTVLTRHNVAHLPETVAFAAGLGAKLIVVSNLSPEGGGDRRYAELAPSLEQLASALPAAADAIDGGDTVLRFFGVPMCILGRHRMLSNDLHWDPRVAVEWATVPGKVVSDGI